jgi:hypothetical protein
MRKIVRIMKAGKKGGKKERGKTDKNEHASV